MSHSSADPRLLVVGSFCQSSSLAEVLAVKTTLASGVGPPQLSPALLELPSFLTSMLTVHSLLAKQDAPAVLRAGGCKAG